MRFNIISNLTNGVGLQQDYVLLKKALEHRGHEVQGVQFNAKPFLVQRADVNIFLEVVTNAAIPAAKQQWVVPNPEWWFAGWDALSWDLVLAKTRDCERIFTQKFGRRCQYIGWVARDLYQPSVKRVRRFLHVAGKSRFKNTAAVIAGCREAKLPLTVVGNHVEAEWQRLSDEDLTHLMNSHFCHIMPSAYEGYGQVLHEALGCGQVIITTDAPPMNEIEPALLVPSTGKKVHHAGVLHTVAAGQIAEQARHAMTLSDQQVAVLQEEGRATYQFERTQFYKALDALVGRQL